MTSKSNTSARLSSRRQIYVLGDRYYLYDSNDDSVSENGLIRTKFPAGTLGEAIPSNLDSVFYDMRDKMTYFFKGEWVSGGLMVIHLQVIVKKITSVNEAYSC